MHRNRLTLSAFAIAAGLTMALGTASAAQAAPSANSSTCTPQHRAELKQQILDAKAHIAAVKLTPQQHADRRAARKAAITQLKAQAHGGTWDAAAIATAKDALAKAKADLAAATDPQVRETIRLQITSLKDQLAGLRGTKLTADQKSALKAQIQAIIDADKQEAAARHTSIQQIKDQVAAAKSELQACRA